MEQEAKQKHHEQGAEEHPSAAVLLIGDELLSGRTRDTNLSCIAAALAGVGIEVREARVVPDRREVIVEVVNALRGVVDYVFTTGGIGPTHDDITSGCIAEAFGVGLWRDPEAMRILEERSARAGIALNDARLRMAEVPRGAELIVNPVSGAPGFRMGNVYVMAGVPMIMRAMLEGILPRLSGGAPILSRTLSVGRGEGGLADVVGRTQERHEARGVRIGSYPWFEGGRYGVRLVARARARGALDVAFAELWEAVAALGAPASEEHDGGERNKEEIGS